jgi:16S rRNA (cytidine1402-2'-O)-methyltransferase
VTGASKSEAPQALSPGLYVVATPIGNLGDMSQRAINVLRGADLIACEDTRVTGVLLQRFGIATPMTPYHDHNAARVRPQLVARLGAGARIALVSDAGTPLISDPGFKLVQACVEAGVAVTPIPGPSALLPALVASALPTDRFYFGGFLPPKTAARRTALEALRDLPATLVFYEAPQRLADCLADMAGVLGDRSAAVCRELTKMHEEIRRDSLASLAAHYREAGAPRGELVIVVGHPTEDAAAVTEEMIDAALRQALATSSVRDAAAMVAEDLRQPRRTVYARALALTKSSP